MAAFRGGFSKFIAPGFRKIVFEGYRERPVEGEKITNSNTSKRAYEDDFNAAGFGTLFEKAEGSSVTFQDPLQGNTKRYSWYTYGLAFRITQEMDEDNLYMKFGSEFSRNLGISARNNKELVMHSPYNNAFDTTVNGFTSGEALCDTHVTLRGVSILNKPSTAADFDITTFQAGIEHFHGLNNESGIPAMFIPRYVLHSATNMWLVNQVLKSQKLPGGQQNDVNYAGMLGVDPLLSHYLTTAKAWFLICSEHDVNYFDRRPFTFENTDDFFTGDALFKGTARRGVGFGGWRGIYGSPGT